MAEKKPLGVLILHGFTGSLDTVRGLAPAVERLGLPYRMPVLRGHGTRYEDLATVVARDWYDDAEKALAELREEVDQVVIVGLSMGGLVTLNLAMEHGKDLAGIVLVAPFLRCADPLSALTPILKMLVPFWDSPNSFVDAELAKASTNYKKFPTATFSRLLNYANEIERRLGEVTVPTLILHSRKDTIAHPIGATVIAERIKSESKHVVWFERSGHEMFQDLESAAVIQAIADHLATFQAAKAS
ncbi:MAG: alpha/beta hydrolase [Candidatus Sericytochromatia bacterium]